MKFSCISIVSALALALAAPTFADQPGEPGQNGQTRAFSSAGFSKSVEATGQSLTDRAADLFGNNGIGNGADPDPLGLAGDHDPNNFGGGPDTDR